MTTDNTASQTLSTEQLLTARMRAQCMTPWAELSVAAKHVWNNSLRRARLEATGTSFLFHVLSDVNCSNSFPPDFSCPLFTNMGPKTTLLLNPSPPGLYSRSPPGGWESGRLLTTLLLAHPPAERGWDAPYCGEDLDCDWDGEEEVEDVQKS
jgi:hypothetical protein